MRLPSSHSLSRWLLEVLIIVIVMVLIQVWQQRDVPSGPAPETVGNLADGRPFDLNVWRQHHLGRPIALHFWATWCPICSAEESSISAVAKNNPVMTIAMSSGNEEQIAEHLKKKSLVWPTLIDVQGRIVLAYGLKGVPAFIVIDRNGKIRCVSTGYTSELGMRFRLWWAEHF